MVDQPKTPQRVVFECSGVATGKMRNELDVRMTHPMLEEFTLASDEGPFHGGDATAPPPLALFVGGLTGCLMTQMRAFAKRLKIELTDLRVETRVEWSWTPTGKTYETAPKAFEIDVIVESDAPHSDVVMLLETAKKGCFIEQTLGQRNSIRHRLKTEAGYIDV
ncbi:MAG: OsmC family protein [Pseudomonadota bacterium]